MNLYVVAKPYDIDQVLSHEINLDSQNDLWLILKLDKKTPKVCLQYLSELNQKNIMILRSPIFSDLFFNKEVASKYFIKVEHDLENRERNQNLSSTLVAYNIMRTLYKIFFFLPAYLYWLFSYFYYEINLRKYKVNSLYTQAWATKLLPLVTVNFKEIVFYDGGKSSEEDNDKDIYTRYGASCLIRRTLTNKRNFAMPFFLHQKIKKTSKYDSHYVKNHHQGDHNKNYNNLKSKEVDKSFLLIAGSYEQIKEDFKIRIEESMDRNDLDLSDFKDLIYRPHPRRKLSEKEMKILENQKFKIIFSVVSLESDLLQNRVLRDKIPGCIFIQNSSAATILSKYLPDNVRLITDEV
tara:strand:- start:160 stop:1212 length:1053 start_codon:yes stop_codon:yes gene_type:complete